jgi:hypothetical protein
MKRAEDLIPGDYIMAPGQKDPLRVLANETVAPPLDATNRRIKLETGWWFPMTKTGVLVLFHLDD